MFSPYGTEIPSNNTVWHPEPTFRGTYNILSTCLITLGLCVWTALHLNIPENGKASKQFLRKASWLLIGLFAPELVCIFELLEGYVTDLFRVDCLDGI